MADKQTQSIIKAIQQNNKSLSEIAREYGISRQRVHQIKVNMNKPKKEKIPKEKKLKKREIEILLILEAREKARRQAEVDALKQKEWKERLSDAYAKIQDVLNKSFNQTYQFLRFEHVDGAGYWFTFELINDSRRQTYCIRHNEI